MKNKINNFWNVYKPLVITFGVILLVALLLGLTCVGVATMDTSTKLAYADVWQPTNSVNSRISPRSLNLTVNEDYSPGLWFNMDVFFNSSSLLDRYLQYFTTPYYDTSTIQRYFQPIGYIYGGYSSKPISYSNSYSTPGAVTAYVLPVGYFAEYRKSPSTGNFSVYEYGIGTLGANYELYNIVFITSQVRRVLGLNYDWRLSNNTYSVGEFIDDSFNVNNTAIYIDYYHTDSGETWVRYPVAWRNPLNTSAAPTGAYIQGWFPSYSEMPQEFKDIYGIEPINCMGANGSNVARWLRDLLSPYMAFGVDRDIKVTDTYDAGYNDGLLVGREDGYNEGLKDGEDIGYSNGVDYAKSVVYTDSASYTAGVDNANRTVTPSSASFSAGYNKGIDDTGNYTFSSLIGAVVDVPVKTLLSLLNFEILGVDMSAFFLSLFTFCLLLLILRMFIGR